MIRIIAGAFVAAVIVAATLTVQAQNATNFAGRLSPVPVEAVLAGSVAGVGSVTATVAGLKLSVSGRFEGMQSAATVARVHRGVKKGVRGPVLFELDVSKAAAGTLSGEFELTASQVEDLGRERFYVQLHSEEHPDGHLWGWLLQQEPR